MRNPNDTHCPICGRSYSERSGQDCPEIHEDETTTHTNGETTDIMTDNFDLPTQPEMEPAPEPEGRRVTSKHIIALLACVVVALGAFIVFDGDGDTETAATTASDTDIPVIPGVDPDLLAWVSAHSDNAMNIMDDFTSLSEQGADAANDADISELHAVCRDFNDLADDMAEIDGVGAPEQWDTIESEIRLSADACLSDDFEESAEHLGTVADEMDEMGEDLGEATDAIKENS